LDSSEPAVCVGLGLSRVERREDELALAAGRVAKLDRPLSRPELRDDEALRRLVCFRRLRRSV
jgi:hypothetical protein